MKLQAFFVGGDHHVELVKEPRKSEQPESWSPGGAEPDRCVPRIAALAIVQAQADLGHSCVDERSPDRELLLWRAGQIDATELGYVCAEPDRRRAAIHETGLCECGPLLVAAETIDERIAQLLAEKRQVVDSLTDGGEETSPALMSALIRSYAAGPPYV